MLLDNDPETGGGADGDILNDDVHNRLLQRISRGEFLAILAAPPCSTFSVTRHFAADGSKDNGPPVVRDRANIRGLPNVTAKHLRELRQANAVVARMTALLTAAFAAGTQYILPNTYRRSYPLEGGILSTYERRGISKNSILRRQIQIGRKPGA